MTSVSEKHFSSPTVSASGLTVTRPCKTDWHQPHGITKRTRADRYTRACLHLAYWCHFAQRRHQDMSTCEKAMKYANINAWSIFYMMTSPVPGEFPTQRPVTRSSDVFFDLCLNKQLSKQSRGWWFETLSRPLLHHRNDIHTYRHSNLIISRFRDFGVFCLKYFTICMSVTSVSNRNEITQHWYQDMNK